MQLLSPACRIAPASAFFSGPLTVDVLRLDEVHPVVSGNKGFKLKKYLEAAGGAGKSTLLTFGGAFSNHLVATAAAAQVQGLQSIGVVRGEEPAQLSHTLRAAASYGMSLHFVSRAGYRQKTIPPSVYEQHDPESIYPIPEGGYGALGAQGAADILRRPETVAYTHVVTAVGSGTTLAGLVSAAAPHLSVTGIPVLKNAFSLHTEINRLLPAHKQDDFALQWDYHCGGYAKYTGGLLRFMNAFYERTGIPTDFVYTGKAFFAAYDLVRKNYFPAGSRLLLVHTGGLQGNRSLKKGSLIYG